MSLIIDLDGTLLNSKERLYRLFNDLIPESKLTYQQYWAYKHKGISHNEMLNALFFYQPSEIESFSRQWMRKIETKEYMKYDVLFDGVELFLEKAEKKSRLLLCTARQNKHATILQLEELGIMKFFSNVFVTENKIPKDELLKKKLNLSFEDWTIGDTGFDIKVGKKLGVKTCAVSSGFLSKETLEQYKPDLLLPSVTEFELGEMQND